MVTGEDCTSWLMYMEGMTAVADAQSVESSLTDIPPLENFVKTQIDVRSRQNMLPGPRVHAVSGGIGECRPMCGIELCHCPFHADCRYSRLTQQARR